MPEIDDLPEPPEFFEDEGQYADVEEPGETIEEIIMNQPDDFCAACEGTGEVDERMCKSCQGKGRVSPN